MLRPRTTLATFLCCSLPYSLETGLLTVPAARLASNRASNPVPVSHSTGVTGTAFNPVCGYQRFKLGSLCLHSALGQNVARLSSDN